MIEAALKGLLRTAAHRYLAAHHFLLGVPDGAVLILGHMRSGSTLLLHLLMTRPELLGAGERNTVYRTDSDLALLARECFLVNRRVLGRVRYVVDQLNHDHLLPDPELLLHHRIRPVILLREPGPSIGSMVRTFASYGTWPVERCAEYYRSRVKTLAEYARLLRAAGRRPHLITYEALVRDPIGALEPLRRALDLPGPFRREYERRRFTGRRGDPSPVILTGSVHPDRGRPVELSSALLSEAEAAYDAVLEAVSAPPIRQSDVV